MPLTKLVFRPGVDRETTSYANEGGWYDCNLVRFRAGKPETIGGWSRFTRAPMLGTGRALMTWSALDGTVLAALGTNLKYYIVKGSTLNDITPIREVTAAGAVTFDATTGSNVIIVTDAANGVYLNDFVTFSGAATLGGVVTSSILNKEHQVTRVIDTDTYEITVSVTANASDTGNGGAAVIGTYQINTGLDTSVYGTGWGSGPWSRGAWNSSTTTTIPGAQLRIWSHDNFGEDLVMAIHDGGIYYWDAGTGVGDRAIPLSALPGANFAPTIAKSVIVSERDRHVIAFGCDPQANPGVQDPLTIRFSDQESAAEWAATTTTTAGELRISTGSEIIGAIQTKQQILVFTDISVHAMQYLGDPFTFGLQEISSSVSIIGPNAMVSVGDLVFWMGKSEFYIYDGTVSQIPCNVKEYIFNSLNDQQGLKVYAGHCSAFSEVWWMYPSGNNTENSNYVVYNYEQRIWYYGVLPRTAWVDRGVLGYPIAASPDGYLYYHENGLDDGSNNPPTALHSYIESSVIDMGEGDQFMFATRVIPDLTFRNSSVPFPTATFTMNARNFPGDAFSGNYANNVTKTTSIPVEQYTDQVFIRLRGRSMSIRVESNAIGTAWRLGDPRLDLRLDGRK